jgi:hypothetical protein
MDNFKAIETLHSGYRFRSRLEARWAIFFETLGIEYQYEKEGYILDGIPYLPDFYLPQQKYWIEIKPGIPSKEEREKAIRLALSTNQPVALFCGDVWVDVIVFGFASLDGEIMKELISHYEKFPNAVTWITTTECLIVRRTGQRSGADLERGLVWSHTCWLECLLCGSMVINILGIDLCSCEERKFSHITPRLMAAYTAARSARFGRDGRS